MCVCVFGWQVMVSSHTIQSLGTPNMMPSITQPIGLPPPLATPPGLYIFTSALLYELFAATSTTDIGNNVPLIWYKDKPGDTSKLDQWCDFLFHSFTIGL